MSPCLEHFWAGEGIVLEMVHLTLRTEWTCRTQDVRIGYTFTQMLYLAYGFVGQACHFLRKKPKTLGFGCYAESTDNNPLSTKYNKS